MRVYFAGALALATLAVGIAFAPISASAETAPLTFALGKVCSPVTGNNWRDTVPVPDTWTSDNCHNYAKWEESSNVQIGCFSSSGTIVFGSSVSVNSGTAPPAPSGASCWNTN